MRRRGRPWWWWLCLPRGAECVAAGNAGKTMRSTRHRRTLSLVLQTACWASKTTPRELQQTTIIIINQGLIFCYCYNSTEGSEWNVIILKSAEWGGYQDWLRKKLLDGDRHRGTEWHETIDANIEEISIVGGDTIEQNVMDRSQERWWDACDAYEA